MNNLTELIELPSLKEYLKEQNLKKAFKVQELSIPPFLENKSLHIHSMTGSGKTFAYLLPLIEKIKNLELDQGQVSVKNPRAVIILPTRELANQVYLIAKQISHTVKLRARHLAGGPSKKGSIDISREKVDLLITSPGKYLQLLSVKKLLTSNLEVLVLDESDQLADMGFSKDIIKIKSHIKNDKLQTVLVSATTPPDFQNFKDTVFENTKFFNILGSEDNTLGHNIETFNIDLKFDEKIKMTQVFLKEEAKGPGIIFLNQYADCMSLKKYLENDKSYPKIFVLHGELTKTQRNDALLNFRSKGGLLIATDLAARGMDFPKLQWILNYDLPFEPVYYLHRSGRVGRAGKFGKVYNFITPKDMELSKKINEAILNQKEFNLSPLKVKTVKKTKVSKKITKKVVRRPSRKFEEKKKTYTRKKNHRI